MGRCLSPKDLLPVRRQSPRRGLFIPPYYDRFYERRAPSNSFIRRHGGQEGRGSRTPYAKGRARLPGLEAPLGFRPKGRPVENTLYAPLSHRRSSAGSFIHPQVPTHTPACMPASATSPHPPPTLSPSSPSSALKELQKDAAVAGVRVALEQVVPMPSPLPPLALVRLPLRGLGWGGWGQGRPTAFPRPPVGTVAETPPPPSLPPSCAHHKSRFALNSFIMKVLVCLINKTKAAIR